VEGGSVAQILSDGGDEKWRWLTDGNVLFLGEITTLLGIRTEIARDIAFPATGRKTERLLRSPPARQSPERAVGAGLFR
jgi:hypothetical protein